MRLALRNGANTNKLDRSCRTALFGGDGRLAELTCAARSATLEDAVPSATELFLQEATLAIGASALDRQVSGVTYGNKRFALIGDALPCLNLADRGYKDRAGTGETAFPS